jgi:hypothetical protein
VLSLKIKNSKSNLPIDFEVLLELLRVVTSFRLSCY